MKANKLLLTAVALGLAQMASANVVTDAGTAVVDGVQAVGSTAWDSTKTVAKTVANPGAVSLEVGTLGAGVSFTWSANEKTEVVAGWTGGNVSTSGEIDDSYLNWNKVLGSRFDDFNNIKVKAKLNNPYVGVNIRPWANDFYVGTGVIVQRNEYEATFTGNADSVVRVNGQDVSATKVKLEGENRHDLAPYLTLGFKPSTDKNWGMFGEVGVSYFGNLRGTGVINDNPDSLESQQLTAELNNNNKAWYPIAKIGATYRF